MYPPSQAKPLTPKPCMCRRMTRRRHFRAQARKSQVCAALSSQPTPYPVNRRPVLSTDVISCQLTPYPVNRRVILPTDASSYRLPPEVPHLKRQSRCGASTSGERRSTGSTSTLTSSTPHSRCRPSSKAHFVSPLWGEKALFLSKVDRFVLYTQHVDFRIVQLGPLLL